MNVATTPRRASSKSCSAKIKPARRTLLVSSKLLERGATMTLACSSTVKLDQAKSGSM